MTATNPREFCRETGYSKAILFTYSFDPVFFENLVLRDLWKGGVSNISVIADKHEVESSIEHCVGRVRHLGNTYQLGVGNRSAFHPKLILKIGPNGGKLWLGSGNITQGGWGGNNEVGVVFELPETERDSAALANLVIQKALEYCDSSEINSTLYDIKETDWLQSTEELERSPVLITSPGTSLFEELRARWANRTFHSMRLFTGSSDQDGRFIRACHDAFGIEKCVITIDSATSSFNPTSLESLPVEISIVKASPQPYLHGKFYWLEGAEGNVVIAGSANCSGNAWLRTPIQGGNVEAVAIYENVQATDYDEFLKRYPGDAKRPSEVLQKIEQDHPLVTPSPYRIKELKYDSANAVVDIELEAPIKSDATLALEIGDQLESLGPSDAGIVKYNLQYSSPETAQGTMFARLRVTIDGHDYYSPPKWVEDIIKMRDAAESRNLRQIGDGFKASQNSSARNKFLNELQLITQSIFKDSVSRRRPLNRDRNEKAPVAKVWKQSELVRSLSDFESKSGLESLLRSNMSSIGIASVIRLLFDIDQEADESADAGDNLELRDDNDGNDPGSPETDNSQKTEGNSDQGPDDGPTESQKKRLKKQIELFFSEFREAPAKKSFGPHRLLEATLYPLLVISAGKKEGWFTPEDARGWLLQTIELLFITKVGDSDSKGLISHFRSKSTKDDNTETFDDLMGDGCLWLALLEATSQIEWDTTTHVLERCLTLCDIWDNKDLTRCPNIERTEVIWHKLNLRHKHNPIETHAVRSVEILKEIENFIAKHFDLLIEKQVGGRHAVGDIVRRYGDWGYVETQAPINDQSKVKVHWRGSGKSTNMKASGFFVNVTKAANRYTRLKKLVEELHSIYDGSEATCEN